MKRCKFCFEVYDEEIAHGVCPYCGYNSEYVPKDPRFLPIGTIVNNRYVVGGVIGDGGFGITYRAFDSKLQVAVALKEYYQRGVVNRIPGTKEVFIAAPGRESEFIYGKNRLLREAQIVSKFQSESIVRVNDFFEENGTTYMVMELLDCRTLEEYLIDQNRPMTQKEAENVAIQLCEALREIHDYDVLHRDIAPDNIFINEEGKIKIIDFGSARLSKDDALENLILVKEGFSPIEQYEALKPGSNLQGPWTDIYAVAATLDYCLTGIRPMESRVRKAAVDNGQPDMQEPMEVNAGISEDFNNLLMKGLAINGHERFKNAEEMLTALRGEVKVLPLKVVRKRKRILRAATIGGGLLIAGLIIFISSINSAIQYRDIVLDETEISVWYFSGKDSNGASNEAAFDSIIQTERDSDQFKNVTINVRAFDDKAEYKKALIEAAQDGKMPNLFECVRMDATYLEDAHDSSVIVKNLDDDLGECWFVADYAKDFEKLGAIPLGFEVPVIYINTAFVTDYVEGTAITSMSDLLELAGGEMVYKPIAIDSSAESLFRMMFSDYDAVVEQLNVVKRSEYLNSGAAAYLSTTSKFTSVRDNLGATSVMAQCGAKKTVCQFSDYWSISEGTEEQNAAAEVLLAYLYTNYAQDTYYLQESGNTSLPVNKSVLDQYDDVHWQFEQIVEQVADYTFIVES